MKIIQMTLKVSDEFCAQIIDKEGKEIGSYEGYVPDFFPGDHYGDYVELSIDIETGKIVNWNQPTQEQIKEFLEKADVPFTD